ncbi:glycosyltransferase family 39 protein [Williamsia maris]|uniref:Integral membrane protein n=1 Tax=Williamsia maris TaxID=72806 RepID=A0ABT1HFC9_9NOCA|nr:glycosyltransferase family 39 protein [Williamsia maris]MCP2176441.1 hypothetical protein [Williamsia maris]
MTETRADKTDIEDDPDVGRPRWIRDTASLLVATALLLAAILVPFYGSDELKLKIFVQAPPLFAKYGPHWDYGTISAVLVALLTIAVGPAVAARVRWGGLLAISYATGLGWTFSLALIDGWNRGVVQRLLRPDEYLLSVNLVRSIPTMLDEFSSRIIDYTPISWPTHVAGHPPGALLTFVWLNRIGLGGGAWAGVFCILAGMSAVIALLVTVRRLGDEATARRIAPFLVLTPGAVWIGVSADGYFMGVAAWGIALLAIASTSTQTRWKATAGIAAGLVLGWGIFLNYGLTLMGVIALAVLIIARQWRPLIYAIPAALVVVGVFAAFGFWWLDGYHLVTDRYYQGIASDRPFSYWVWGNFAATLCAVGPAVAIGLGRSMRWTPIRTRNAVVILGLAALLAMLIADLSALSKAETERIWLPFSMWTLVTTALIPPRWTRVWLAGQVATALLINHLVFTYW